MAIARLPNQGDFELPDEIVMLAEESTAARERRDTLVRRALAQFAPSALNASLTYTTENGHTVVKVTPKLGTKALSADVFVGVHEHLRAAPPYLDPALALAWEIRWSQLTGTLHPIDLLLHYRARLQAHVQGEERRRSTQTLSDLCRGGRGVGGPHPPRPPPPVLINTN